MTVRHRIIATLHFLAMAGMAAPATAQDRLRLPSDSSGATKLAAGQFLWHPEYAPSGPVLVLVSIPEQVAYVYRNGIAIGISTVSTGKAGHRTPTGVFTILEKHQVHHSSRYNDASMPYQERLTWDGIALHAGNVPGYPTSHGCIHLPYEFSKLLFGVTQDGGTVIIADDTKFPVSVAHPGFIAPEADSGAATARDGVVWQPGKAPTGPVSIVLSAGSREVHILRNGVEIGRAPVTITTPEVPLTPAVYMKTDRVSDEPNVFLPGKPMHVWIVVGDSGRAGATTSEILKRVRLPAAFAASVYDLLAPGTTLVVTNEALMADQRGSEGMTVIASEEGK